MTPAPARWRTWSGSKGAMRSGSASSRRRRTWLCGRLARNPRLPAISRLPRRRALPVRLLPHGSLRLQHNVRVGDGLAQKLGHDIGPERPAERSSPFLHAADRGAPRTLRCASKDISSTTVRHPRASAAASIPASPVYAGMHPHNCRDFFLVRRQEPGAVQHYTLLLNASSSSTLLMLMNVVSSGSNLRISSTLT